MFNRVLLLRIRGLLFHLELCDSRVDGIDHCTFFMSKMALGYKCLWIKIKNGGNFSRSTFLYDRSYYFASERVLPGLKCNLIDSHVCDDDAYNLVLLRWSREHRFTKWAYLDDMNILILIQTSFYSCWLVIPC